MDGACASKEAYIIKNLIYMSYSSYKLYELSFYFKQFNGSHYSNTQTTHKMDVRHLELAHANMTLRPKYV